MRTAAIHYSHEAFQQAIAENPEDSNARAIYADWLEDHAPDSVTPETLQFLRNHQGAAGVSIHPQDPSQLIAYPHYDENDPDVHDFNGHLGRFELDRANDGFRNGRLRMENGQTYQVGGGWTPDADQVMEENQRMGLHDHHPRRMREGGIQPYEGYDELGDIGGLMRHVGLEPEEGDDWHELADTLAHATRDHHRRNPIEQIEDVAFSEPDEDESEDDDQDNYSAEDMGYRMPVGYRDQFYYADGDSEPLSANDVSQESGYEPGDPHEHWMNQIEANPTDTNTHFAYADWLRDQAHETSDQRLHDEADFREAMGKRMARPVHVQQWRNPRMPTHHMEMEDLPEGVSRHEVQGAHNDTMDGAPHERIDRNPHLAWANMGTQMFGWRGYRNMDEGLRRAFHATRAADRRFEALGQAPPEPQPLHPDDTHENGNPYSRYALYAEDDQLPMEVPTDREGFLIQDESNPLERKVWHSWSGLGPDKNTTGHVLRPRRFQHQWIWDATDPEVAIPPDQLHDWLGIGPEDDPAEHHLDKHGGRDLSSYERQLAGIDLPDEQDWRPPEMIDEDNHVGYSAGWNSPFMHDAPRSLFNLQHMPHHKPSNGHPPTGTIPYADYDYTDFGYDNPSPMNGWAVNNNYRPGDDSNYFGPNNPDYGDEWGDGSEAAFPDERWPAPDRQEAPLSRNQQPWGRDEWSGHSYAQYGRQLRYGDVEDHPEVVEEFNNQLTGVAKRLHEKHGVAGIEQFTDNPFGRILQGTRGDLNQASDVANHLLFGTGDQVGDGMGPLERNHSPGRSLNTYLHPRAIRQIASQLNAPDKRIRLSTDLTSRDIELPPDFAESQSMSGNYKPSYKHKSGELKQLEALADARNAGYEGDVESFMRKKRQEDMAVLEKARKQRIADKQRERVAAKRAQKQPTNASRYVDSDDWLDDSDPNDSDDQLDDLGWDHYFPSRYNRDSEGTHYASYGTPDGGCVLYSTHYAPAKRRFTPELLKHWGITGNIVDDGNKLRLNKEQMNKFFAMQGRDDWKTNDRRWGGNDGQRGREMASAWSSNASVLPKFRKAKISLVNDEEHRLATPTPQSPEPLFDRGGVAVGSTPSKPSRTVPRARASTFTPPAAEVGSGANPWSGFGVPVTQPKARAIGGGFGSALGSVAGWAKRGAGALGNAWSSYLPTLGDVKDGFGGRTRPDYTTPRGGGFKRPKSEGWADWTSGWKTGKPEERQLRKDQREFRENQSMGLGSAEPLEQFSRYADYDDMNTGMGSMSDYDMLRERLRRMQTPTMYDPEMYTEYGEDDQYEDTYAGSGELTPDDIATESEDRPDPRQQWTQAIHANPFDSNQRLAFADYLTENAQHPDDHDESAFQQSMADWMQSEDRPWDQSNSADERTVQFPWHIPGTFMDAKFPEGVTRFPFYHADHQNDTVWSGEGELIGGRPQPHHARWDESTFGFHWPSYPHMEQALRGSFMKNRQRQRAENLEGQYSRYSDDSYSARGEYGTGGGERGGTSGDGDTEGWSDRDWWDEDRHDYADDEVETPVDADQIDHNQRMYERGAPTMYVTPEEFQHVLSRLTPHEWRGSRTHPGVEVNNRLVAADMARDLGMDREAELLGNHGKHLFMSDSGEIEDAGELSRRLHQPRPSAGYGQAAHPALGYPDSRQYMDTALWSSTGDDSEPLDAEHDAHDIHPETMAAMKADMTHFFNTNRHLYEDSPASETDMGHNFWLSRNGHGDGFFADDSWSPEDQERLQDAAEQHGPYDLYVGDDGMIHGSYGVPPNSDEGEAAPEPALQPEPTVDTDGQYEDEQQYTRQGIPTHYVSPEDVHGLLQQLAHPQHNHTRWATPDHPENDQTFRQVVSDALRDTDRHQEADWLADLNRHVLAQDGRVLPGRFTTRHVDRSMSELMEQLSNIHGDYPFPEVHTLEPGQESYFRPQDTDSPDRYGTIPRHHVRMLDVDPAGVQPHSFDDVHMTELPARLADMLGNHDDAMGMWEDRGDYYNEQVGDLISQLRTSPVEELDPDAGGNYEPQPERTPLIMDDGGLDEDHDEGYDDQYQTPPQYSRYDSEYEPTHYGDYTHEDFHRKIMENPKERTHHHVYADWLEENNMPVLANFIRQASNDTTGVMKYTHTLREGDSAGASRRLYGEEHQLHPSYIQQPMTESPPNIPEEPPDDGQYEDGKYSRYEGSTPTMYADARTIRALLKNVRSDPYDETNHGILADALEEAHPDSPVPELIRRQYGMGQHAEKGPRQNNWYDPHDNIGSFRAVPGQINLPGKVDIGWHGPFRFHLGHEGGPGQPQNWVVHAASTQPGSSDFAYSFEFPHEEAHQIPQMFPAASKHIWPKGANDIDPADAAGLPAIRQDEANRFNDLMDRSDQEGN